MKKVTLLLLFLSTQVAFSQSQCSEFQIKLIFALGNERETYFEFDCNGIDSINWNTQTYYIKKDFIKQFEYYPFGSSTMQFVFLFEGEEIYRAAAMSKYNSNLYPEGVALYKVYEEIDRDKEIVFKNNAISIVFFERAFVNKEFFSKAYKFLKDKRLIVDE